MSASRKGATISGAPWSKESDCAKGSHAPQYIDLPQPAVESVWTMYTYFHSLWCISGFKIHV